MNQATFGTVRRLLAEYLRVAPDTIAADSNLEALGLDSLGALEVLFQIEEEFKISVGDQDIPELTTVGALCERLETLLAARGPG